MKAQPECFPCFLRQALQAAKFSSLSEDIQKRILQEVMEKLLKEDWNKTPPELAHIAHAVVRKYAQGDPYAKVKKESNDLALSMYPELKKIVEKSDDPLRTAVRIAIAGNIIDFGALESFDVKKTLDDVLKRRFRYDDFEKFKKDLERGKRILFFADNAGEIVFDKLLIETIREMKDYQITLVVKEGPIINDATLEDAKYTGIDKIVDEIRFIGNGEVGIERNSPEVGQWIKEHDVIISKGQGNCEGLSEFRSIFYLLMIKCPVIARYLNGNVGDIILLYR